MTGRWQRIAATAGLLALWTMWGPGWAQEKSQHVIVYDGSTPSGPELAVIARTPVPVESPRYGPDTVFIPKSANGHFYTHGFLNGFPVTFMVDSGASAVAIPEKMARIAGIRAGVERVVQTAGGQVRAGVSQGNTVGVGPIGITGVEVVLMKNLDTPLLGASVLDQFRISIDERGMTLSRKPR